MMKSRKIISLGLVFCALLASCGQAKDDVEIFLYDASDTFISSLAVDIESSLARKSLSYNIYDGKRSQLAQNDQIISSLDSQSSSLLLVNLVDRLSASSIVEKAKISSTPILFFNREPLPSDLDSDNVYYVGSDPAYEGMLQSEMAASLFGDPGNISSKYDKNGDGKIQIVLLKGEQSHQAAENRSKYCIQGLKDKGYDVDLLTSSYCDWSRSKGYAAMKSIYNNYGSSIELLLSNNDDMAVGAINYLVDNDIFSRSKSIDEQPFPIIGVDATSVGVQAIEDNLLYGTVKNDASTQADALVTFADYYLSGKPIDDEYPYTISPNHSVYIKGSKITLATLE